MFQDGRLEPGMENQCSLPWETSGGIHQPPRFCLLVYYIHVNNIQVFAHSWGDVATREHTWRQHSEYAGPKFYDSWIPKSISKYFW